MTNKEKYEGARFESKSYGWYTVIEYNNSIDITVKFDTGFIKKCALKEMLSGGIKDPTVPNVYGVGFIGAGKYTSQIVRGNNNPCYDSWKDMLKRCYSEDTRSRKYYFGCTVDNEWLNYQNFAEWYYSNIKCSGRVEVDKDLLIKGNKIYSAKTCSLVPQQINTLFSGAGKKYRGKYPLGVHFSKERKQFAARLERRGEAKTHLGWFTTAEDAFLCYKHHKEIHVKETANKFKDMISEEVYDALMKYEVDIND